MASPHAAHLNFGDELSHLELLDLLHVVNFNFLDHTLSVLCCIAQLDAAGGERGQLMILSPRTLCPCWRRQTLPLQAPPIMLLGFPESPLQLPASRSRQGTRVTFMTGFFWKTSTTRSTALSMTFTSTGRWISGASRNLNAHAVRLQAAPSAS